MENLGGDKIRTINNKFRIYMHLKWDADAIEGTVISELSCAWLQSSITHTNRIAQLYCKMIVFTLKPEIIVISAIQHHFSKVEFDG